MRRRSNVYQEETKPKHSNEVLDEKLSATPLKIPVRKPSEGNKINISTYNQHIIKDHQ